MQVRAANADAARVPLRGGLEGRAVRGEASSFVEKIDRKQTSRIGEKSLKIHGRDREIPCKTGKRDSNDDQMNSTGDDTLPPVTDSKRYENNCSDRDRHVRVGPLRQWRYVQLAARTLRLSLRARI